MRNLNRLQRRRGLGFVLTDIKDVTPANLGTYVTHNLATAAKGWIIELLPIAAWLVGGALALYVAGVGRWRRA